MSDVSPEQDPDICPGPCNRAWEAAELRTHHTGEPHNLHPNPGRPIWCHDCKHNIEETLRDLPTLTLTVPTSGKLNTPPTETGRLSRADIHASPSPAFDFHDELQHWITGHVTRTAHLLNQTPTGQNIGYLINNLSFILSQDPDGIDFGITVNTWRRRLINAAGGPRLVHRIPGTCPHCDKRGGIRRANGEDLVKCQHCGAAWDIDHWAHLVRAVLAS